MLVFHQNNGVSTIRRMLFYYCHLSIFVFLNVFVYSSLMPCMLMSTVLRAGVKIQYTIVEHQNAKAPSFQVKDMEVLHAPHCQI